MNAANNSEAASEVILNALGAGLTHVEAAVLAGVTTKTVQRRLADPAFAAQVVRLRALQVEELTSMLSTMSVRAVSVIGESMDNDKPLVRLRAAEVALTWMTRLRREVDFEFRLARLELPAHAAASEEDD